MVRLVIASIHTIQPAPRWGAEWRWRELIRAGPLPGWTARSCGPLLPRAAHPRDEHRRVRQLARRSHSPDHAQQYVRHYRVRACCARERGARVGHVAHRVFADAHAVAAAAEDNATDTCDEEVFEGSRLHPCHSWVRMCFIVCS